MFFTHNNSTNYILMKPRVHYQTSVMATPHEASLYYAVENNDAQRLCDLLDRGLDVDIYFEDAMNISSKSLLHVCCGKGHYECVRVMIDHGAKLDVRDRWGQTPLMYCVSVQFSECAQLLLETSADLCKCQDRYGKSPLHCAVEVGNIDLVRMLLQYGADINLRRLDGFTPLMTSCSRSRDENDQLDIIKVLIEHGALIDLFDYSGKRTALHIATISGNFKAVEALVNAGADINIKISKDLRTPLTSAIYSGVRNGKVMENHMNIINFLVAAGAELNASKCETCNPLVASAQTRCPTLLKLFLQKGANPNIKFPSGITPSLISTSQHDVPSLKILLSFNCDLTAKGSVFKRMYKQNFVLDSFQMALLQNAFHLCIFMIMSGYPVFKYWDSHESRSCLDLCVPKFFTQQDEIDAERMSTEELCHGFDVCKSAKLAWIVAKSRSPRSLRDECIFTVRSSMGRDVSVNASLLPLPKILRDCISLKHILSLNLGSE